MTETAPYMPIMLGATRIDERIRELQNGAVTTLVIAIPMAVFAEHESQAQKNHGQTLDRLRERGGLSACEAVAILENRSWRRMDPALANNRLLALLDGFPF